MQPGVTENIYVPVYCVHFYVHLGCNDCICLRLEDIAYFRRLLLMLQFSVYMPTPAPDNILEPSVYHTMLSLFGGFMPLWDMNTVVPFEDVCWQHFVASYVHYPCEIGIRFCPCVSCHWFGVTPDTVD